MPRITAEFLTTLIEAAERSGADALIPTGLSGPEPLCAVYHREARNGLEAAFTGGVRAVREALPRVRAVLYSVPDLYYFQNVNTPEEWAAHGA
jgi:molybdopterin-guanine dinucleotide biosynthesis protein A